MIQTLAKKLTQILFDTETNKEAYEIHQYGIEAIIATSIDLFLILLLGFSFKRLVEAIVFFITFCIMRKFTGGYHCKTNFRCISLHAFTFFIYLVISKYFENMYVIIGIDVMAIVLFLLISPINNRNCNESERMKYKRISIFLLLVYIILSHITAFSSIITYVIFIVSVFMIVCIPVPWKQSN